MAIKAPPEAKLQVPHPSQVSTSLFFTCFSNILGYRVLELAAAAFHAVA